MSNEQTEGIKKSIETIIGSDTILKRKKKTEEDINRELFEKTILTIDQIRTREVLLQTELGLDYSVYNEKFYEVIDTLFHMYFGAEATEIIFFYIYERVNPDGSINDLIDENDVVITLQTPSDLWYLVNHIKNKTKKTLKTK
jgi:hypothetical protein